MASKRKIESEVKNSMKKTEVLSAQIVASMTKSLKDRSKWEKHLKDFNREQALELYEHLVVDLIEDDEPVAVFDMLLDTLLIAHDAITKDLTLEEVKSRKAEKLAAK